MVSRRRSLRTSILGAIVARVSCCIFALNFCSIIAAQPTNGSQPSDADRTESLISDWIARGEHKDLPWRLTISKPQPGVLTSGVLVTTELALRDLLKKG